MNRPWYSLIDIPEMTDPRGVLWALEFAGVPFTPQRLFWTTANSSTITRGEHAHHECHQLLFAVSGDVTVDVHDGERSESVVLDSPSVGLHVPPLLWAAERAFSTGAVLGVLASHGYDNADYIRDFDDYQSLMRGTPGS